MMTLLLSGQEVYSSLYINDVIIFNTTWDEHLAHIRSVLSALRNNGLMVKLSKCIWCATEVEYLSFLVGGRKITAPEARVEAIRNFKRPTNIKELRSFLRLMSYYR